MAAAVRIADKTDDQLDQLAKRWKMSKKDVVGHMANYIIKYQLDIRRDTMVDPGKEFRMLRDTVVGFIREQENRYLLPTKEVLQRVEKLLLSNPKNDQAELFKSRIENNKEVLGKYILDCLPGIPNNNPSMSRVRQRKAENIVSGIIKFANKS